MVIYRKQFLSELKVIFDFIAKDSHQRAVKFRDELLNKIDFISNMPFICRKSQHFSDESIRELIFKGYVIPFLISSDDIIIFGIYNANKWELKE
ncbi:MULTISPECIES: type II toxin-antitoxin system RelE/ParE family toxin [unclassified Campylobacter]|uniref:type II toxin-antitoxin system RelE/ParE family toxin n=1 Tax=unclassified Campylobacter TaxID=2593542 RepID=UPI003D33B989